MIDFQTHPDQYRHWKLRIEAPIAYLTMDVDPEATLRPGYELKMNSYDLGVDIELYDAVQRLRFEHPEVRAVVLDSGKERIFCAGANIRMLGASTHAHKVNFCKFTNETRNGIEDASACSGQRYLCAVNGTAAGGGYELALATDHILMVDDDNAAVSLPEVPLLAVLPGTGGLTRLVDKRKVRRDLADVFCAVEEGIKGQRAVDWRLVDEIAPASKFADAVRARAEAMAATSDRPADAQGVALSPLQREIGDAGVRYPNLDVAIDRGARSATLTLKAPPAAPPADVAGIHAAGVGYWPLALARELDDAILHLRTNEPELGTLVFKTAGDADAVAAYDAQLQAHGDDWLVREITLYWKRTLKRVDVTSRTIFTLVEPGSCFVGLLAELLFAADRSYMLVALETRFLGEPESIDRARATIGQALDGRAALAAGLVTFAPDDIDWEDEVRFALEERASFSPDALTGLEANLRFAGAETCETKIFGRLSAWQNWIFQRPNAVSEQGALKLYGTGSRPNYNRERV